MDNRCSYCGDELITAHRGFGICGWCIKEIQENQERVKRSGRLSYFNVDRDEYKEEIDYG